MTQGAGAEKWIGKEAKIETGEVPYILPLLLLIVAMIICIMRTNAISGICAGIVGERGIALAKTGKGIVIKADVEVKRPDLTIDDITTKIDSIALAV